MKAIHATTTPSRAAAGFTLIELMVTVSIAAILLAVAAPSFVAFQRNSELTSATNSLLAGISAAKGEAMKRGLSAVIVPASNGDWGTGWKIFVDRDRNQTFSATADTLVAEHAALPSYLTASGTGTANGSAAYIMFDPSGYTKTAGAGFGTLTLSLARNDVADAQLPEQTRRIVVAATGRVRTCKPATDTTCTTAATE